MERAQHQRERENSHHAPAEDVSEHGGKVERKRPVRVATLPACMHPSVPRLGRAVSVLTRRAPCSQVSIRRQLAPSRGWRAARLPSRARRAPRRSAGRGPNLGAGRNSQACATSPTPGRQAPQGSELGPGAPTRRDARAHVGKLPPRADGQATIDAALARTDDQLPLSIDHRAGGSARGACCRRKPESAKAREPVEDRTSPPATLTRRAKSSGRSLSWQSAVRRRQPA